MTLYKEIINGTNSLTCRFPEQIDFETTSSLYGRLVPLEYSTRMTFDLRETREVHSSFIGFLIDMKRKFDRNGGQFSLKLSPYMETLFEQTNLIKHFNTVIN